jgi:hypothetical protein
MTRVKTVLLGSMMMAALALAACGGDATDSGGRGDAPTEAASTATASVESGGSGAPSDFPAGYLEGEWCDSQGLVWKFEGRGYVAGTASAPRALSGGIAQLFGSEMEVVSVGDDEWVGDQLGERVTFTRGPC